MGMVPSTTQRAYEMCPDVYADLADETGEIVCPVDETKCYQATLCDGVMGNTYQCEDLIAQAENMPAKDLCPCTCAEVESGCTINVIERDSVCSTGGHYLGDTDSAEACYDASRQSASCFDSGRIFYWMTGEHWVSEEDEAFGKRCFCATNSCQDRYIGGASSYNIYSASAGCNAGEESDDSEEPSDTTTEAVVIPDNTPAPTKEVKVQMKLSMTDEQYEEKKGEVKTSVSKKFGVAENLITINKVAGRRRSLRRILSEVNLEVGIQTHEEDRVTAIIDEADFAADMGERVSAETGLTVTVSGVEKLPTVDVTSGDTVADDGSDDDTDMTWLWIVLAVVGVLACGGIAYVVINTQDGAQGEKGDIGGEGLGGESLGGEGEETKRSPGAQAMHDKL